MSRAKEKKGSSRRRHLLATGLIVLAGVLVLSVLYPLAQSGSQATRLWALGIWGGALALTLAAYWLWALWSWRQERKSRLPHKDRPGSGKGK